ncbi:MAG: hypothetical protein EOO10_20125 [Chitinophagaceae bacterium]|nr:MAG: hypothetical protein EOO10_20125 [Chitinophagaceae bacterium]
MKQRILTLQALFFLLVFNLFSLLVFAQENSETTGESTTTSKTTTTKTTDIDISADNGTGEWYTQPWIWIVGAAVFILLLIALLRGGGRDTVTTSDRVTVKKTVERDRDVDGV